MGYTFLEHSADAKFRVTGETLEDVFIYSSEALNEVIRGDIEILGQEKREFEVEGADNTSLLYEFLEWFIVALDSEDFLVREIKSLEINDGKLKCVVVGDNADNYKFTNDVKAVTYSEMYVRKKGYGWECQVVLDV